MSEYKALKKYLSAHKGGILFVKLRLIIILILCIYLIGLILIFDLFIFLGFVMFLLEIIYYTLYVFFLSKNRIFTIFKGLNLKTSLRFELSNVLLLFGCSISYVIFLFNIGLYDSMGLLINLTMAIYIPSLTFVSVSTQMFFYPNGKKSILNTKNKILLYKKSSNVLLKYSFSIFTMVLYMVVAVVLLKANESVSLIVIIITEIVLIIIMVLQVRVITTYRGKYDITL